MNATGIDQCAPEASLTFGPVLVVDADLKITGDAGDLLRGLGLTFIEASTTDEALSYLCCRTDISGLVVSDDARGCLSGRELAEWVQQRTPEIGVIVFACKVRQDGTPENCYMVAESISVAGLREALHQIRLRGTEKLEHMAINAG